MAASILVVDDDEGIRELLRLHLSAAGYEVNVAEDAIAAGYPKTGILPPRAQTEPKPSADAPAAENDKPDAQAEPAPSGPYAPGTRQRQKK